MKKFMIFLLMAFLYLGTCQARSESAHPNDGRLKLLSWVSPTPSQSFLTRSDAVTAGDFSLTPSGSVNLGVTTNNTKTFTRPTGPELRASGVLAADQTVTSSKWYLDNAVVATSGASYTVSGLNAGTHTLYAEVSGEGFTKTSNPVTITVAETEFTVEIVGLTEACPDQTVILTSVIEGPSQVTGQTYLWKIDGEAAPGVNTNQTYEFIPSQIFSGAEIDSVHEFVVEVNREGCLQTPSPVHYFRTLPVAQLGLTLPTQVCETGNTTLIAENLNAGTAPVAYKWFKNGNLVATTTTNEYVITNADLLAANSIWVAGVYDNVICNTDTVKKDATVVGTYPALAKLTLKSGDQDNLVCENSTVTFTIEGDANATTANGAATYTWFVNDVEVGTTTDLNYNVTLEAAGTYQVKVTGEYANYPCGTSVSDPIDVTVEAAPAIAIAGDNVICQGQTTNTLIATPATYTYAWLKPGATTAVTGNSINADVPGDYTVTGTATSGCTATATYTVYQFGGDLQVSASNYYVCPGEVVALNANYEGFTNENITYTWEAPTGVTLSNTAGSTVTATIPSTASGALTFKVTATAAPGCSIQYNVVVNVIPADAANLTVSIIDNPTCVGGQVKAKITNKPENYNGLFTWYLNGIEIPGENLDSIMLHLNQAGTYTFGATLANTVCNLVTPVTAQNTVTVNDMPEITITGDNVICQNASATMTATNITGASYTWAVPTGVTASGTNVQTTTIPGVYAVTASKDGCQATAEFTVYQLGGDLQVYASEQDVCPGTSVMLNANLDGFGNQNIAYKWDANANNAITPTVVVTPSATNTYTVTAYATTADAAQMETACQIVSSISVNVIQETNPTVTVSLQSDQHICEGGLVNLKANASNVSAYTWYMDGIEIPGQNLPEIALNLYDLGTHTFAAKPEGFVCITPNAVPADKSVTVHAVPQVTVTGADVICNGNTTTLTANVVPAGNYTYAWTGPNTTGSNATLDVTVAGVYTVVVKDPTSKCVATADFTVYATGADLQLTADKMEICKGGMVVLNANLDGFNNENVEYAWTGNGLDAIATGSTVHATPNAAGLQKYVVTATAGNCTMKDSLNINVVDVVNVATVVPSIEAVCVGEQVTLQANAAPAGSATEFIWYMNGVEIAGENQPTITMNMNEAGNYSFAAKAAVEGCHTSTASTPVTVTVNATPVVVITGEHYYTTDANNPAVLTATPGYASYAWSNGATENPLNVTEYGVYTVTVTDANECVGVSEPFTVSSMVDMQAHIEGVDNACQHDDVTLTAVVDNDLEGHTYQWMVNGQYITDGHNIAGATTAHLTFNVDSLYKYYGATLTNEFTVEIGREGCATVTAPVHPFTINPVPYVMVVAPEMVCEGNGATLEAAVYSIGENAQYQYIWFKDNNAVDTIDYLNTYNVAAEDIAGHTYAVQAIFQNSACSSDTSEAVTIQFYQKPVAIKMNVSDPSNICETNQATLTITDNNAENTFGAVTYTWFVNGIEVPNVYGNLFTADFDHNGEYKFWATAHYANYPCADIYTDTVKVNVNNVPELAIVGDNVICAGQATNTLTATTGFASYVWTKPDGTTDNAGNTLNANTPGHYTLVATATAANGGCVAIEEFEVTQFGSDIQVTADKMELCEGEMVTLNANLDGFIDENVTYTWTGSGLVATTGSTVAAIPAAAGTQTYKVTAATPHCSVIDSVVVTVHALPAAVTATLLTDADICAGEQATLQAIPASTDLAYIWFQNGIQIPGENLNTITVNLNDAGTYNYSVIAVNQYGCYTGAASTTPTVVGTVDVPTTTITNTDNTTVTITITNYRSLLGFIQWSTTETETTSTSTTSTETTTETLTLTVDLSTLPVAKVTVHAAPDFTLTGNNIVCNGATATINATSNTADTYTYTWSDGTTGATFTTTTAGTYSVTATDGTCTSTQTFNVYTNGSDLQVYADKMEVCEGEMVVLNANLAGFTNDNIAYTWAGEGLVATTGSTVSAIPTMANHTYTVTATTTGTNAGCTMTGSINITVHPVPAQVTVLANRNTVCEGGQITFNADGNANAYIWYQNGVEIPGENQATLTINFNEIGSYAIAAKAVSENGCISALASEPVVVNVVMQPTVQITGDPIICHTDPVVLYANLNDTDASLDYTYEWRLYNYTLGAQTIEGWLPIIGAYTIPNPIDAPAFMDMPILTTAILGNENFVAIDPTLGFPAQDYPYIFTVVVTTPEGCRVESEPYYVYVGEDPEVVVTVDYDTVCSEGEITATAHLGNWNMDNLVAQWQVSTDGGETWTNIDYGTSGILHHVPGVTSQYRIVVTQTTTGCTATSEPVNVAVIVPASIHSIVAINHDETYPTDNVCEGAQLDVTAYLVQLDEDGNPIQKVDENGNPVFDANGEPVYETYIDNSLTYMWKLNGMELQTVHGAQFSAQAYIYDSDPVDYTYEAYIVYDMPGCELVPVASNTVHVKRNPIVTIDGNPNVCYYGPSVENIVLTAWVDGRVDLDATYTWYESGQYRPNPSGFDNNYRESWVPTYENPYIFTVEVTNGDGCTTISDPFYVNVYERPYTNITGDASEICEGGNVTLRANLDNYNDPMLTYQWYKNEVNNTHILPGATHEVETFEPALGATNYIVKVTHLMDFNTQYCVAYDTFRVNVNAIPVVTAMNDLSGVDTICEGRTVKMTATTIGGVAGGEVYTWYRNGEIIENVTTNVLVDAPTSVDNEPAQYVYSVKVRQAASGCESETFTFAPIVVNPNPTIELVTDPIVCAEGANNVVLYANVDPMPATTLTYRWFEDNAPVAVTEDSVYMFTKPYRDYPYSFAVELVNDYGCVARAEASVYVNAAPVVNITATETQICNGGEITLTATLDDWNADMLTFQWYDGETAIAGANELSYTVVPTVGAHDYHVAIHQLTSLCDATSNHIAVNVVADPVVTTIANNIPEENAVCDGYQVELTANIEGGVAGGETYVWYRNGEIIEGAVAANFSEVVSALNNEPTAYTYAVEVAQTAAGCASTVKTMNAFTVNPNPTIELVTDPIVCAEGENNVVLYANVEPTPATAIEYKWLENNAVFATTTVDSIALTKPYRDYPYSFAVQIVNEYACSATSEALVYVNAAPVVNITATETNICEGGEITLTATLNDWNADQLTFQWYDGETAIAGATELSYTVVPALGSHDYHVAIHQLTSLCDATSNHITVTVNEIPVIASVTASQYNICNGGQLTITATPEDGYQAGEVYTWYRNGVLIPGAVTATINDTPATVDNNTQQYVYTAVVTRPQAGCTSDITVATASSSVVTVYPNPVVVITGDQHVCETDSVFLIANVDTTGMNVGSLHYTWYESGQIRDNMAYNLGDNSFYAEYFYARTEPYRFTVNVERNDVAAGCASMSAEYLVYVYPQPVVNITASETQICTNGEVTLTANLNDNNAENIIYQWYEIRYHDVTTTTSYDSTDNYEYETHTEAYRYNIPGATAATYTTNLAETTTLGVMVRQTNSECWANDEVEIVVNPIPVVTNVTVNGVAVDTVCDGAQVTVAATINANGTPGEAVYTWYRNGVLIEGANEASFSENVYTTDNHVTYNNYTVVVTLPASGCTSEMSAMAGVVRINPAPTTVSISGINTLCENDSTVLTAYSDVEGEWTWSTGSHEQSITVPAGVYTVTLKTVEGCEMTSEPFTVEALGTDLLVSASATSICRGEHTTLYVNQDGWQGNVTYAWDAQADNSTATTVDVQPDSTTTYHVTATVSSTNGSCTAEGEVTIIVHQLPAAFEVTASATTICEGNQITFTAPADPQVTGYIWYQNGVEIEGENQNVITVNFNEAGNYTFAAKAISLEGCVSAEASEPVTVTVTPAPSQVTITGVNVLCENTTTTLTAQSDVEGIFVWSTGDTATTVNVPAGSYNVTIITAEGCQLTSDNFNVEAFGTDLLVSASATSICRGEHTTLYVDQNGWQGNVTYAWDAQAGNSTATTVDVQPDSTTTYHVTATVSSTNGSCTAEGEVTIIVNQLPAQLVVNATTATTICEGNQVSFHATGDATTTAYIWYQNGVEIAGENQADLTVNYNEAGNYAIAAKAISNEGCVSALASEPVVVTVTPAPSQVTISGNNVLCETSTTTLTAQSDVDGIFVWSTGDTAATVTVPAGSYTVTMITAEGCQMTSDNFTVEAFGTDLIVSATATSICQGDHTTLSVDQNGWQGNVTYAWDALAGNSTATTVDVQPAATTTYTVTATVSSTNGSCTAVGEVTIVVNPLPVVAAVTATETVVCEGTQVTFTAAGDANTTAYIWYNNGVEIAGENQATLTVNFNEEGVYNYAVKAISTEGCVSAVAVNAPAVTVNAAPESVTISGNTVICDGGITTLYANVVPNQPATYTWFKDNVVVNANTESLVVTAAGSYKVVAAFNGCSTESDAVVVTVEQAPQMQLTATESTICAGGTTVITAEATGWNNGNVNYTWSNNYQGSAYTFTPANAGTYTFYVTASQATAGCQAVDSITINVNEIPATPVVTVDNAVVCDGGQVTLQVTNGVAGASYIWTKNGVVMAGANGATLYDSPVTVDGDATNYVYTVVAELPISGCTSNASANTVVTVIPTPVVAVSVEGNTTLCAGGSTTLHANVTPANANYNYQWYKDNVLIEGATTADYTAAEVARETAYNFSVVVTANAGCNVTANAPAITFVADPVVEAVISNNISCVGGTATLTAIVDGGVANVNGLNGYTFEWYRNNPNNEDPNNPYSTTEFVANTAVYTTTGNEAAGNYSYWVTVTSNYGCQTTSAPVNYSVIADPVVTIAVAQGYAQAVCDGGESMLKANVTGGYGEVAYQWYKNGNLLVGETNQTLALNNLTYGVNDIYTVEVAQTGVGCGNSASAALNTLVTVAPTYTVNITGFGNVCEGGLLTLNATVNGVLNGDVLSYQWYRVANGTASAIHGANAAQYQTSDLLLGDSYEYYVVVTSNISGCSVVSTSVPANVVAAPTVAIQGANTVCEGGDLTLNAFVNGGVEGAAYTYTWNWTGAANGSTTTAVPTFVPTVNANDAATPYYFTVTISRNDNTGCTATSAAHEVNVLAVPTVSVTADNSNVCVNGQVTFTAHVSPVGAYNYVWTINGQQQAVNAATVTTSMANTGTINASVVVAAANASASCSATATIATPVNVVAAPTVTLAANHTTMCVGGVTTLTATVNANNNIPGNFNYEWIVDGTPVAGVTNTLNQTLNAAGIHTYQVRVSQNNELGCSSTWSNQATVQVAEQPVVTLSSADGLAICEGGSITLTGVVTNYGNTVNGVTNSSIYGNMTFDWTANGVNVHHNTNVNNAQNQVTETLNTVGNYTYQVSVDAAGYNCQPQISNEYTVNVVGNPSWTDVHVYSNNGTDACLGETVYLMAGIQGGVSDYAASTNGHIQWVVTDENGNTVNVGGGLGGNSYDVPTVAGTYIYTPTFVGNIGSGCQLTNTDDVQVAVTVHELPTAEFISGDGVALCANDPSASAELVISFTGVAPFHYQVVDGNGNIIAQASTMANTATIYVAPTEQTTYMITTVQDAYCQNSTLESTAVATVYVNDIEFADNFFVSGCTDNGQVTISFNMISGNPSANFTVVYENGMQASGTIVNNTATFAAPTAPGDYNAVFTVDGCSYDIVVRVLVGDYGFGGTLPIMDQRWNDVVVVNNNPETNGGHTFVGFQWYHNGVAIPGATYSNYQDKGGLNGFYSVELTEQDADGNMITFMTCEMYFNATSTVKVYPVPANVRQEITIELDLTAEELEGAVLDIYSVTGAHVSHVTDLQPITKIEGFKAQGTYFGRILTGTNEIKTVKFVIVK